MVYDPAFMRKLTYNRYGGRKMQKDEYDPGNGTLLTAKIGNTRETIYRIGFWFLIIYLIGIITGIGFAHNIVIERKLKDAIKLGGIVIDNTVYDLKARQ
jgi:hypothetical protein